ncbi:MAG: hypothetical protein LDL31_05085 [Prosthecobacter sp.]|jgi:hypothetical protein|nr:hypothetical protein [Prosthecobacter sp.]
MKTRILLIPALCASLASCANSEGGMNKGLIGAATGGLVGALLGDGLLGGRGNNRGNGNVTATSTGSGGSTSVSTNGGNNGNGSFLDDNAGLIAGAVGGYAAGALTDSFSKNEIRQKYLDGYNKGRSDAIKELYWLKRDAERPGGGAELQRRYYEVPVPEHVTTDGVLVEPRRAFIEVVE